MDGFDFHLVFGLFRLAAIAQQIYRRHTQGHTRDPQFAAFGAVVNLLERRCLDTMAGRLF